MTNKIQQLTQEIAELEARLSELRRQLWREESVAFRDRDGREFRYKRRIANLSPPYTKQYRMFYSRRAHGVEPIPIIFVEPIE
jgi:hypothetical protein